ncbi:hypothetical protein F5Y17DRAFT_474186 [Xylariaceae sp. FL0594]|nr:hypothetical protein F5Y17DRAFT_474186 [Xylariaceae sp. FL0594]
MLKSLTSDADQGLRLAPTTRLTSWDATSLAVALPTVSDELYGTTLVFFWANVSFMLGVLVVATARTMAVVVAGRLIQGLGAGGLDVLQDVLLADIKTLKERPLLSTGDDGWINLPVIGLCFLFAFFSLNLKPIPMGFFDKCRQLDRIDIALFASGSTAFSLPLSWAGSLYPWSSWRTILPLVIGPVLLCAFALYERYPKRAMMPYRLFSNITANAALVTGFIHGLILTR